MRPQSPRRGPDERGDGRSREGSLGKERLDPAVADLPGGLARCIRSRRLLAAVQRSCG